MRPWFRRGRGGAGSGGNPEGTDPAADPRTGQTSQSEAHPRSGQTSEPSPDPSGPLSVDRLDDALKRLRQEIPAPSDQGPSNPSE
jgi:hypothetical protein